MADRKTLEALARNCNEKYCSFAKFLEILNQSVDYGSCPGCKGDRDCENKKRLANKGNRLLFQYKESEIFACFLAEVIDEEVPIGCAMEIWAKTSYAEKFHEYYDVLEVQDDPMFIFPKPKKVFESCNMTPEELREKVTSYKAKHKKDDETKKTV